MSEVEVGNITPQADDEKKEVTPKGEKIVLQDCVETKKKDTSSDGFPEKQESMEWEHKNYDKELKMVIAEDMDASDLKSLRSSVHAEASHCQCAKQGLCILLMTMLILMNLFMGSSSKPSIIGVTKCGTSYWII